MRLTVSLTASILGFLVLGGCGRKPVNDPEVISGETMGTTFRVLALGVDSDVNARLGISIKGLLDSIAMELSTWESDSWISEFNRLPAGVSLPVPAHASSVLACSIKVAELSEGALNPAIYPLVKAWGFASPRGQKVVAPEPAEIDRFKGLVDYRNVVFDENEKRIRKTKDGVEIDCSAVAKGYAIDAIAEVLTNEGVENFLIELGGELRAQGQNGSGNPWSVRIESVRDDAQELDPISLTDESIATSGGGYLSKRIDGEYLTHILDPSTGTPMERDASFYSVSVIAPSCMMADALATAAFVLGPKGLASLRDAYPEAEFIFTGNDGSRTIFPSGI
ncbi:MAG: FAD:protein FMN transferase [Verrucomicrobiota bacterium]